jgi:spore germination cell wall hydrolase CwlJ-like protein
MCKLAVAYSILNRVEKPSWWGSDIMSVVFKKWQYSSLTNPKDPQLTTWPEPGKVWEDCLNACNDAMNKTIPNPVPHADSYYDTSIPRPKWAIAESYVGSVGRMNFYNVDRDYERA